jgi:hypothetical protein
MQREKVSCVRTERPVGFSLARKVDQSLKTVMAAAILGLHGLNASMSINATILDGIR